MRDQSKRVSYCSCSVAGINRKPIHLFLHLLLQSIFFIAIWMKRSNILSLSFSFCVFIMSVVRPIQTGSCVWFLISPVLDSILMFRSSISLSLKNVHMFCFAFVGNLRECSFCLISTDKVSNFMCVWVLHVYHPSIVGYWLRIMC